MDAAEYQHLSRGNVEAAKKAGVWDRLGPITKIVFERFPKVRPCGCLSSLPLLWHLPSLPLRWHLPTLPMLHASVTIPCLAPPASRPAAGGAGVVRCGVGSAVGHSDSRPRLRAGPGWQGGLQGLLRLSVRVAVHGCALCI